MQVDLFHQQIHAGALEYHGDVASDAVMTPKAVSREPCHQLEARALVADTAAADSLPEPCHSTLAPSFDDARRTSAGWRLLARFDIHRAHHERQKCPKASQPSRSIITSAFGRLPGEPKRRKLGRIAVARSPSLTSEYATTLFRQLPEHKIWKLNSECPTLMLYAFWTSAGRNSHGGV